MYSRSENWFHFRVNSITDYSEMKPDCQNIAIDINLKEFTLVLFGLFNGISTFEGYLMPNPSL